MTVVVFQDWTDVELMLTRLDTALSPVALATFLSGPVEEYLMGRIEQRFADEGDDVVGGWQPLHASTNEIREALGYSPEHPINVRTGEMLEFLTAGGDTQVEPYGASVRIPRDEPVGELQQKLEHAQVGGTQEGYSPTVPRPVMGMNLADLEVMLIELGTWIGQAQRFGL